MLGEIEPHRYDEAVQLLNEGFVKRPRSGWRVVLERIETLGGNRAAGVPAGYFLLDGTEPVGVILTPASVRVHEGRLRRVVNLSSWYIRESHRWRAPVMLRAVLRTTDAMFTDLTPTLEVRRMLPAFGFEPINAGVVLTATAAVAPFPGRGARVEHMPEPVAGETTDSLNTFLAAHSRVGCWPVLLRTPEGDVPLLFRPRRLKGLPAAKVVYSGSVGRMQRFIPAIGRYLLARGVVVLVNDDFGQPLRAGQFRREFGLKFAKPGDGLAPFADRIDYAGSELCVLDF